ncbi:MAG: hypothetical protein ACFB10_07495 [Salibacteraceae bacterium]
MTSNLGGGEIAILLFVLAFFALGGFVVFTFLKKSRADRKRMEAQKKINNSQES